MPGFASTSPLISTISWSIVSGSPERIRASTARASKSRPAITSQRGLCGILSIPTKRKNAGTAPRPSIQRHSSLESNASPTR